MKNTNTVSLWKKMTLCSTAAIDESTSNSDRPTGADGTDGADGDGADGDGADGPPNTAELT